MLTEGTIMHEEFPPRNSSLKANRHLSSTYFFFDVNERITKSSRKHFFYKYTI